MERCMGDLNWRDTLVVFNNLIVFSDTLEEHESRLLQVLKRLRVWIETVSRKILTFLDLCQVSGLHCVPTWSRDWSRKDWSFLGFFRILSVCKGLLQNHQASQGSHCRVPTLRKLSSKVGENAAKYLHPKESFGERWTPDCQRAFSEINSSTTAPVLGFANSKLS